MRLEAMNETFNGTGANNPAKTVQNVRSQVTGR